METIQYYINETKRPGKFQGEHPLAPFLWEEGMEGGGEMLAASEDDSFYAEKFTLTQSEKELFGVDESEWALIEDSQGFVFTIPVAKFERYNR